MKGGEKLCRNHLHLITIRKARILITGKPRAQKIIILLQDGRRAILLPQTKNSATNVKQNKKITPFS